MTTQERFPLANAAETYGVAIPGYLATATTFLAAATKYRTEVEALAQPTLHGVNATNIGKKVDAILAAAQHDERLALAARVEHIADGDVETAYMRFKQVLMDELAAPFDKAAKAFMAVHDANPNAPQDLAIVATLANLVRIRDLLAPGRVGDSTPAGSSWDIPTRCATMPDRETANKVAGRTQGMQRGAHDWCNAMLSLPGVRLAWQTPAQQDAQTKALPAKA